MTNKTKMTDVALGLFGMLRILIIGGSPGDNYHRKDVAPWATLSAKLFWV
jgi:hypothetical protein